MDRSFRLLPRVYTLRDDEGQRRRPRSIEVLRQYLRTLNFVEDSRNALHTLFEVTHLATLPLAVWFFLRFADVWTFAAYSLVFYVLANVYNTLWYHRYCSHFSFRFASPWWPRLFLWLNPLGYREEVYALRHHVHHNVADEDDDPNGPHLGWLGNYLASSFEIDTDISEKEYERLKQRLAHLHVPFSSYESFQRWACIESVPHYLARWSFANLLWASGWFLVGGVPWLLMWCAVLFSFHAVLRDFNFRGHGGGKPKHVEHWDFDDSSLALNQRFYGLVAGEWHNNHHAYRASANCGFLPGQLDAPFLLIKLLHACGVVARYNDHQPQFEKRFLSGKAGAVAASPTVVS